MFPFRTTGGISQSAIDFAIKIHMFPHEIDYLLVCSKNKPYLFRLAFASFPKTKLLANSSATPLHFNIRDSRSPAVN